MKCRGEALQLISHWKVPNRKSCWSNSLASSLKSRPKLHLPAIRASQVIALISFFLFPPPPPAARKEGILPLTSWITGVWHYTLAFCDEIKPRKTEAEGETTSSERREEKILKTRNFRSFCRRKTFIFLIISCFSYNLYLNDQEHLTSWAIIHSCYWYLLFFLFGPSIWGQLILVLSTESSSLLLDFFMRDILIVLLFEAMINLLLTPASSSFSTLFCPYKDIIALLLVKCLIRLPYILP